MKYQQRKYPQFSACGLNCGLCPRHHTAGASRCPGCAGYDFLSKHPTCGVLTCSQRKEIDYCYQCSDFPCEKYDGAADSDSFITHQNQMKDMYKAKSIGIDIYVKELNERISILKILLENYDDGRRKSFFCTALALLDLHELKSLPDLLASEAQQAQTLKERAAMAARLLQAMAEKQNVSLKLRKKTNRQIPYVSL